MTDDAGRLESLFAAAAALPTPADRAAFLDRECADDPSLRDRLEILLRAHQQSSHLLDRPAAAGMEETAITSSPGEREGSLVAGRYKLLEQIGEGGMGAVWLAEQTEPLKRQVALKIVKPGMDSRAVLARFEAERQALALMDHPNIAQVHDGGVTEQGRPFFVMELVKGPPLTEYCDARRLSVRERLELFVPICSAVQHAHQKGIIHRDLKPSNVLVTEHDGRPIPKVIDFGLAKALSVGTTLTDRTLHTAFGAVVGTPLYMAPEQIGFNAHDVDTRSDVYSLGVMLYELLTGTTPLEKQRFKEAAWDEVRRVIREEEPPKPSSRLLDSRAALPSISAQRQSAPTALTRLVRGELDWIVMKALEKDRNRRYETANGFLMDVQRYLADEPVQACPPSAAYRLKKFVRRNKGSVALAGVLGFAMLIAVGAVAGSLGWAARERSGRHAKAANQIELIQQEVQQLQEVQKWPEALASAKRAEAVIAGGEPSDATRRKVEALLKDVFFIDRLEKVRMGGANWSEGRFDNVGADREYVRAFREYGVDVDAIPIEQSIERLRARSSLVVPIATALDDWAKARGYLQADPAGESRLVAVARGIDPNPLRDRLRSTLGRPDSEIAGELRQLGESIDVRTEHPVTLSILCDCLVRAKQTSHALRLLREAQRFHPDDFWLNFDLAVQLANQEDHEGAVRFYTAAVSVRPHATAALNQLGIALRAQNKPDEGMAILRRALEEDPRHAFALSNLGNILYEMREPDEAATAYRKAIALDPQLASAYAGLGNVLRDLKKPGEAAAAYGMAADLNPRLAVPHVGLGNVLVDQGKHDEAAAEYRKAIDLNPKFGAGYTGLGNLFCKQNKLDEAVAAYRKSIEVNPRSAKAHNGLANALRLQENSDEAVATARKAIDLDPQFAAAYYTLGLALQSQEKLDSAIAAFHKAIDLDPKFAHAHIGFGIALREQKNSDAAKAAIQLAIALDPQFADAYGALGDVLYDLKKPDEAEAAYRKAIALNPQLASAHAGLGDVLRARKRRAEAISAYRKAIELAPRLATAHNRLGVILFDELREYDQAAACFRRAAELKPKDFNYHRNIGNALYAKKDLDGAGAAYREALKLNPRFPGLHVSYGNALRDQKKFDQAVAAYRKEIELNPQFLPAYNSLGSVLCYDLSEYDQAVSCFRKALELDPKNAYARTILEFAQGISALKSASATDEKRRDPKRALALVDELIVQYPQSNAAWQFRGWVLYRLEDWKLSVDALEKSCRLESGGDAGQWIVLALAHAKLAEKKELPDKERAQHLAEARRRYEGAIKQIDRRWPTRPSGGPHQVIWDFRAEARGLFEPKDGKK